MRKIANGNWNGATWQPLRAGIENVVLGMETDTMCCTVGRVENGNEVNHSNHKRIDLTKRRIR